MGSLLTQPLSPGDSAVLYARLEIGLVSDRLSSTTSSFSAAHFLAHCFGLIPASGGAASAFTVPPERRGSIQASVLLVVIARYVPNRQFLSIPFRSELIHSVAQAPQTTATVSPQFPV
jgi:hypothetical protein